MPGITYDIKLNHRFSLPHPIPSALNSVVGSNFVFIAIQWICVFVYHFVWRYTPHNIMASHSYSKSQSIELNWYLLRPIIGCMRFERWIECAHIFSVRLLSAVAVHLEHENKRKTFAKLTGIYCSMRPPGKIPCNFGPNLRSLSNVNTTVSVKTVSSACSPWVRP